MTWTTGGIPVRARWTTTEGIDAMVHVEMIEKDVRGFRAVPYADLQRAKKGRRHTARLSQVPTKGERVRMWLVDGDGLPEGALFEVADYPEHLDRSMLAFVPGESESFVARVQVYRLVTDAG